VTKRAPAPEDGQPTELLFLAPGDVRKARVEPISWMRTCEAFAARGLDVTLASLKVRFSDAVAIEEIWDHFDVPRSFRVMLFPTPLTATSSTGLSRACAVLISAGFASRILSPVVVTRRSLIVYARTPALLAPFAALTRVIPNRRPKLVFETHALPPAWTWRIVRSADLIVVNSRRLQKEVVTQLGLAPKRVLHAPLPPYAPTRVRPKDEARRMLGLPQTTPIACYTGKMTDEQCEFLLRVGSSMRERIPGSLLILVGGNPEILPRLRWQREKLGLEDTVLLPGFVPPAMASVYQSAADVLVHYMDSAAPHFKYCTPAKAFDYQAAGRPIVARDLPLFEEVFGAEGERALRVNDITPNGFVDAVQRVLAMEDGGKAMTKRALAWIGRRSWQARADAVLEALNDVE
jgi:glycosyltransferase involved in cell wall biosynthesis